MGGHPDHFYALLGRLAAAHEDLQAQRDALATENLLLQRASSKESKQSGAGRPASKDSARQRPVTAHFVESAVRKLWDRLRPSAAGGADEPSSDAAKQGPHRPPPVAGDIGRSPLNSPRQVPEPWPEPGTVPSSPQQQQQQPPPPAKAWRYGPASPPRRSIPNVELVEAPPAPPSAADRWQHGHAPSGGDPGGEMVVWSPRWESSTSSDTLGSSAKGHGEDAGDWPAASQLCEMKEAVSQAQLAKHLAPSLQDERSVTDSYHRDSESRKSYFNDEGSLQRGVSSTVDIVNRWEDLTRQLLHLEAPRQLHDHWVIDSKRQMLTDHSAQVHVCVEDLWKVTPKRNSVAFNISRSSDRSTVSFMDLDSVPEREWVEPQQAFSCASLIIHPLALRRTVWLCFGFLLLMYEAFMLSMQAYDLQEIRLMEYVSVMFWSMDIIMSFMTGVVIKGDVVMVPRRIALNYVASWFLFDLSMVLVQWLLLFVPLDVAEDVEMVRLLPYGRFARLARMVKFQHVINSLLERVSSLAVLLVIKSAIILLVVVLWIHVGGCGWFFIGKQDGGWVENLNLHEAEVPLQYFISTHWAVTQIQGNTDIYPGNVLPERCYAVCFTFLSIGILAAFVSKLTSIMLELTELRNKRVWETRVACDILSRHGISADLSVRVRHYIAWKQTVDKKWESAGKEIIDSLPQELRRDLLHEMRWPHVKEHPLLAAMRDMHSRTMRRICYDAMRQHTPSVGETIYSYGERCSSMYALTAGQLTYTRYGMVAQVMMLKHKDSIMARSGLNRFDSDTAGRFGKLLRRIDLRPVTFLCEGALWRPWVHHGDLIAPGQASMLIVDASQFARIVMEHLSTFQSVAFHAARYAEAMELLPEESGLDLFDSNAAVRILKQAARLGRSLATSMWMDSWSATS